MKVWLTGFASGALFAGGLVLSGMTDPGTVRAFLDVFGSWNPSVAFVMAGAIGVHVVLSRVVRRRGAPRFGVESHVPITAPIDAPLVVGAALFGMGSGLSGYWLAPAIVSLGTFRVAPMISVAAMAVGMALYAVLFRRVKRRASPESGEG